MDPAPSATAAIREVEAARREAETQAELKALNKGVTNLEHAVFGNGQPGIKTRIERMEGSIATTKWLLPLIFAGIQIGIQVITTIVTHVK